MIDSARCRVFPVIHHLDRNTTLQQAKLVSALGADGLFLISHGRQDDELPDLAAEIKLAYPALRVGLNFLWNGPIAAAEVAVSRGLDMMWGDYCGVDSHGVSGLALALKAIRDRAAAGHPIEVFASVAFKGQPNDANPALAATHAMECGFTPTTSGARTGAAPDLDKIVRMSAVTGGNLAITSGMTLENVGLFELHLSAILVATGVSIDEHRIDPLKLQRFLFIVRNARIR